jgi:hypothetical protein
MQQVSCLNTLIPIALLNCFKNSISKQPFLDFVLPSTGLIDNFCWEKANFCYHRVQYKKYKICEEEIFYGFC